MGHPANVGAIRLNAVRKIASIRERPLFHGIQRPQRWQFLDRNCLLHGDRHAAHSGRDLNAYSDAMQLEDYSSCVLQHDTSGAGGQRSSGADCAVSPGDVSG